MTPETKHMLQFITNHLRVNNAPPTFEDILELALGDLYDSLVTQCYPELSALPDSEIQH